MPTYAFVDSVAASPTVLFDLDNQSPFSVVEGTQTPPPTKRYSSTSSTARDGDNIAQSSYNDRVLSIVLRVELGTTAEQQVEGIQKLNRLLDGERWLMWQHDTMIEPVFFRTRRGDIDVSDSMMVDHPKRIITLTIPAEPFAYGLPVTGTSSFSNNPSVAGGMSYTFPEIQGDVATPLDMRVAKVDDLAVGFVGRAVLASQAMPAGSSSPLRYVDTSAMTTKAGSNYSWSTTSAAKWTGGSALRLSATGVDPAPTGGGYPLSVTGLFSGLNAGDYRVFLRARGDDDTIAWKFKMFGPQPIVSGGFADNMQSGYTTWMPRNIIDGLPGVSYASWVDLGVVRLPVGAPISGSTPGLGVSSGTVDFALSILGGAAGHVLDLDGFMFVPVGLDKGVGSSFAKVLDGDRQYQRFNAITSQAYMTATDAGSLLGPITFSGSLPSVVPGAANFLYLIQSYDFFDAITGSVPASWAYYPRYLYIRPATT